MQLERSIRPLLSPPQPVYAMYRRSAVHRISEEESEMIQHPVLASVHRFFISRLAAAAVLSGSITVAAATVALATVPGSTAAGQGEGSATFFDNAPSCL